MFRALRSIGQMPDVEYGRIEDRTGRLLVEVGAGVRLASDIRGGNKGEASIFRQLFSQSSEVSAAMIYGGRNVGQVILLGPTEGTAKRFVVSLSESLAVAVAAVLIGLVIATATAGTYCAADPGADQCYARRAGNSRFRAECHHSGRRRT